MSRTLPPPRSAGLVLAGLLAAAGCSSGRYPVLGKVHFPDGKPLDEGMVICELADDQRHEMVRGVLKPDGTFVLGGKTPGDGALPGRYKVLIAARALSPEYLETNPPFIDPKYEAYETSGLTLEVKPERNAVDFTVTKSATWKPKPGGPTPKTE